MTGTRRGGAAGVGAAGAGASRAADRPERLREALDARTVIAQAEGALIALYQVSTTAAQRMLRDITRRTGRPLLQVAGEVLISADHRLMPLRAPAGNDGDRGPAPNAGVTSAAVRPPARPLRERRQGRRFRTEVSPRQPDGTIYVRADGNWTRSTAGALRAMFAGVGGHHPTLVIADLSGVMVMDSTGLGVLLAAQRDLSATSCPLELHNPPPHISRLLAITGLARAIGAR